MENEVYISDLQREKRKTEKLIIIWLISFIIGQTRWSVVLNNKFCLEDYYTTTYSICRDIITCKTQNITIYRM